MSCPVSGPSVLLVKLLLLLLLLLLKLKLKMLDLLLAHVTADAWVCHKGRAPLFVDTEDPFDVTLLEVQDLRWAVVATATTSRRRTGKTPPGTPLIDAARMRPTSWSSAVAYAFWKAEEERSKSTNLPFRPEVAAQGFERNPFE